MEKIGAWSTSKRAETGQAEIAAVRLGGAGASNQSPIFAGRIIRHAGGTFRGI